MLSVPVDTMIPEANEKGRNFTGLILVAGFMTAFLLGKMESGVGGALRGEAAGEKYRQSPEGLCLYGDMYSL